MNGQYFRAAIFCVLFAVLCMNPSIADEEQPTLNETAFDALAEISVPKEGFTFVVWGDCRNDGGTFDDVMSKINEIKPVFSIGLGDYICDGTTAEFDVFIPRLAALEQPLISVPGNHDYFGDVKQAWIERFGEPDFSFDFGGVRFICLDNADYDLDEEELAFLEEMLDTQMPKIVLAHCPPDYGRWSCHCFKKGSDALLELLEKYKADYAFFAHIHLYDELKIGDTQCIVTGGAGAPIYKKFGFGIPENHVVKVTVTPAGIRHEYVAVYDVTVEKAKLT